MERIWLPRAGKARPEPIQALRPAQIAIAGGGHGLFELADGDRLTVTDPEGLQAAEIHAFGPGQLAGLDAAPPVLVSKDWGRPAEWSPAARTQSGLLLAKGEAAGASAMLVASGPVRLAVVAPGPAMAPDAQDAPSDLIVEIVPCDGSPSAAPPPLAGGVVSLDRRIAAATAAAYRVKAGDYIQIIDVDGRQCSDFLAFDAAALEAGTEFDLDATTTRTLMGTSFATPGLHAKYFDRRMQPLIEIVQDTVGRHDTFLLACTAKYYADMGYPGHANCTDNFNAVLAPHGVKPRAGWPAINFFYNTSVGGDDRIGMDEPWSRPGDYVLLRALRDLVCASSSCADDIDPANGWEPTDIHLRVYDGARSSFVKGKAHRMRAEAEPRLCRESGFHRPISRLTRNFEDYRGFWLPTCFSAVGPIAEYWACRERAVVMDLSALRKFEITGPDAEALLQRAVPRNVKKLAVGQVVYTPLLYPHGGMIDDGTIFRLGANNFRFVCGDEACGLWLRELAKTHGLHAFVRSSTDQLNNLAVQGPRSGDILAAVLQTLPRQPALQELTWFRFTIGRIGEAPVLVSRTGYTGELGFEVWCHPTGAEAVWEAIWAAGQPHGLAPMGLAALDMVRIEAGLAFAGFEFCDATDPFEAGIGFTVPQRLDDPYVGDVALAQRRAAPQRVLVGLDIAGNDPVAHGDSVHQGRAEIGIVTSATRSPLLGKTIALARLDVAAATIGTAVEIGKRDGHRKKLPAVVVPFPHYDPQKTRVRADWAAERE
ncbi:DUF1989 domain-containing protein [Jiella sp. MQZ9-1]|uniref:Aminomethyltransferase family protein n=1 Tax=Jiella flava TaxID=2816857 RepID=A0A939FXC8_9HYPH|nr:DUF1989 domain-containing protein [Jiella flava]MBO0662491.1 aminomethyltransferase family protein [Jiella flava]MCD2471716.1 DUF1989 domain-containing protein [Jiella flava]